MMFLINNMTISNANTPERPLTCDADKMPNAYGCSVRSIGISAMSNLFFEWSRTPIRPIKERNIKNIESNSKNVMSIAE
jgi:hypothetical protein